MAYKYKIGLQGKTALVLGGLVFSGLLVSSLFSYWQSRSVAEQKVMELQQSEFTVLRYEIERSVDNYRKNLLSLLGVPPIQAIVRARYNNDIDPDSGDTTEEWRDRMLTIFGAFLSNHTDYLQIRIIDTSGEELVKVKASSDGYSVAADDELEKLSDQDYVAAAIKLQRGEVYFSDVRLSRERGVIQLPPVPVMMLATPIYGPDGRVVAVIVMNICTDQLFSGVHSVVDGVQRSIVDDRGHYIKHVDAAKTFGFDLPVVGGFQVDEPELTQLATHQDQLMRRDAGQAELDGFQKIYFSPQDHSRYWLLTMNIPESVMFKDIARALNTMLFINLCIGLLSLLLIAGFISRKILKPVVDLARAANCLRQGDLSVRVDAGSTRDEFYTLYSAINAFAENQQKATEQLDAQTKRLAAVINNVAEGIVTIDMHGKIESVNPATSRMFGYSEAEMVGQNVRMLMPEAYRIEHDEQLQRYLKTGERKAIGKESEKIGQRKDGSTFPVGLDIREFLVLDQRMYIGVVRDITEQNKAQSQLISARVEAESANQAKTEFLSSMSHELRTPLNAILGFGQLLEQSGDKASAADQHTFVEEILKAGNHLLDLVSQVLDLSRIEEGHLDLQIESVKVAKVLDECLSQLQVGLPAMANVTVINELDYNSPDIAADRLRLKQVIINLLSNAAKYNRAGGAIIIRSESTAESRFRISIADTGVGISAEGIGKLFDPFERLAFKHGSIEGTGIGLTVTKRLVEAMDGSLGVDSTEGKGSTFWFELPLAAKDSSSNDLKSLKLAKLPDPAPGQSMNAKPKVLHIEDNPANVLLIKEILDRRSGYQTMCSTTAEEGLALARKEIPDIILMDIELPGMDGHAALKILKSDARTCHIPVIAISADQQLEQKQGFDEYLIKPINIKQLYAAVEKYTLAAATRESEALAS